jgi:AraC-like DNA-binding protein
VKRLWYFEGEPSTELARVFPTGASQLLLNLHADALRFYPEANRSSFESMGPCAVSGCYTRPFAIEVDEQRRMVGVTFEPGGARPFFGVPAQELRDAHVALPDLWISGRAVRDELEEASEPEAILSKLEEMLASRFGADFEPDPAIEWAIQQLGHGVRVGAVVEKLGLTPRRFIQRFEERVGLKPKMFERISRFQRALASPRNDGWAALAAEVGYADQAHFIRDFKEFAGVTPSLLERV